MVFSLSSLPAALPFPPPSANPRASPHLRFLLHPSLPRSPPSLRTCSGLCHVTGSGPPSPEPEDPLRQNPTTGLEATFYRVRDGVQIFFSVLFWMSLFFWACAWDGRDNTRLRKGSRFKR